MELYEKLTDLNNTKNLSKFLKHLKEEGKLETLIRCIDTEPLSRVEGLLYEWHASWVYTIADEIERSEMLEVVGGGTKH